MGAGPRRSYARLKTDLNEQATGTVAGIGLICTGVFDLRGKPCLRQGTEPQGVRGGVTDLCCVTEGVPSQRTERSFAPLARPYPRAPLLPVKNNACHANAKSDLPNPASRSHSDRSGVLEARERDFGRARFFGVSERAERVAASARRA